MDIDKIMFGDMSDVECGVCNVKTKNKPECNWRTCPMRQVAEYHKTLIDGLYKGYAGMYLQQNGMTADGAADLLANAGEALKLLQQSRIYGPKFGLGGLKTDGNQYVDVPTTGIYVASKTRHAPMWKVMRDRGVHIVSSWIDEAGEGETGDFGEFWTRVFKEVSSSRGIVAYGEPNDFPHAVWVATEEASSTKLKVESRLEHISTWKGTFIEIGAAMVLGKPVALFLPEVKLEARTYRPLGSWLMHPRVRRCASMQEAIDWVQTQGG